MRKPLLTDEVLEEARRQETFKAKSGFGYYEPDVAFSDLEEADWEEEYTGYQEGYTARIPVESSMVKSRRIETVKREAFRSKVNKIFFWAVVLVILFIIAVIFW